MRLNPDFKIVDIAYQNIARRLLRGETPSLRRRLLEVLFKDGKFQWQRLENLLQIARNDEDFDILPTASLGLQFLVSEDGQYIRNRLIMAITEDNRLHTEEVQKLWNLVKDDVTPSKMLGVAWNAILQTSVDRATVLLPPPVAALTASLQPTKAS